MEKTEPLEGNLAISINIQSSTLWLSFYEFILDIY